MVHNPFLNFATENKITLRDCQIEALDILHKEWDKKDTFAIEAFTGVGKSLITMSIVNTNKKTRVITNSNMLVNQYYNDFGNFINKFYGASNYASRNEFQCAKQEALYLQEPVVTNTVAHLLLSQDPDYVPPEVLVIDECDASIGLLSVFFTKMFKINYREYMSDIHTYTNCINYLDSKIQEADSEHKKILANKRVGMDRFFKSTSKVAQLTLIKKGLLESPELFCTWKSKETVRLKTIKKVQYYLNVKSVFTPEAILRNFLGYKGKVILMSGTLFKHEIPELLPGRNTLFFNIKSPIEKRRRQILIAPSNVTMTYPRNSEEVAAHIDEVLEKYKHLRPCLTHLTYNDASNISLFMKTPHLVYSDKIDKEETVRQFIHDKKEAVLLGPGLSVGIDLKDDLCRLNLIPVLKFPNIKDDYVTKRLALPNGRRWYATQTIREIVQSAGRSTRNLNDYSLTIITDNRFARFYNEWYALFPESFREAVVISEKLLDKTFI